ncbi:unnamed protein product [Ectocarpus sp. 12 AP-2014]
MVSMFGRDGAVCTVWAHGIGMPTFFSVTARLSVRSSRSICSNPTILRAKTFMTRFISSAGLLRVLPCSAFGMPFVYRESSPPPQVIVQEVNTHDARYLIVHHYIAATPVGTCTGDVFFNHFRYSMHWLS